MATSPHHGRPAAATSPPLPRVLALLVAAALLMVGLTPAQASAAPNDGSTFDSPLPMPLTVLDDQFTASNVDRPARPVSFPQQLTNHATWYEFTAPVSTTITIEPRSTFDNALEVWTATRTLVAYNDDQVPSNSNAKVSIAVSAGTTYRFAFGAASDGTGVGIVRVRPTAAPGSPTGVTATPGDRSATVSWTAPAGAVVTGYSLTCVSESGRRACGSTTGATEANLTGLANGTPVTVEVVASNSLGTSAVATTTVIPVATTTITITTDPATVVSNAPFSLVVAVTRSDGVVPTGLVAVSHGDATASLPLVDGTARLPGLAYLAGTVPVTATFEPGSSHAAGSASLAVEVGRAPQTVTLAELGTLTYGDAPVTLAATASSHGVVTYTATGACSVTGTQLRIDAAGACTVTATQAGTSEIQPATTSVTVTVAQLTQTLTLDVPGLEHGQTAGVVASSSAGLPVTLAATGACTVADGHVTATDVGTCTVTATQAGTADVVAADPVSVAVEVQRRAQTVTIEPVGELVFSADPLPLVVSSSLGLPVTVTAAGACVVEDGALRTVATGTCTVTAVQPGDARTLPADASTTVLVTGPAASTGVTLHAEVGELAAGAPFTVRASGVLPGSDVVVTVYSTPRERGRVAVGADGAAVVTGTLPVGLEPGAHRLVVGATGLDGAAATATLAFTVGADGVLERIGDSVLTRPLTAAPATAATGAAGASLAATGPAEMAPVGALAVVWLLLGAALVGWRRRATA